ncbi:HAMP domain-containing histidine kinase [Hymenobacter busanensis]|uniref:histidine kinase n=1 Tax=Hymenobacter busanensis TaxID=2607656 RepID=A0A7L4ZXL7_9BACT|nr:HAMP domain-containing sensor histidine kinase [Hymenobacter busanensis]KAA9339266.1 HAMP domain-containing histidine kinase [Hymenobacter busanensis]QHJ06972.1 HAMP domain-containing protein [Hymenobacter busanensis]
MSIRLRLALQFAAIVAVTLLLFSLLIYYFTARTRSEVFERTLRNRALVVAHVYFDAAQPQSDERHRAAYRRYLRQFYRTLPDEEVRIYNAQGRIVFREGLRTNRAVPKKWLAGGDENLVKEHPNWAYTVGLRYRVPDRGQFLVTAWSVDADSQQKLRSLRGILLLGLLTSLVLAGVGGWVFAGQALRPMRQIVREVSSISASDLHRRLSRADGHDEVSQLALTFNRLLDRLETAFVGQRTFVRDASHELRTPLTVIIGELEVALLQPRSSTEYHRVLQSTLDAARLLKDLTNGLLQIARASDDPSQVPLSVLHLDELLLQAHEEVQRRHPTYRIDLEFQLAPDAEPVVHGNEALLLVAVLNVLENACKFSQGAARPVLATLVTERRLVRLEVRDWGVGMAEADRLQVFVPFFRADNARGVPGHGIGLPLTHKIMELHGGAVRVASTLGEGTQVQLEFPRRG